MNFLGMAYLMQMEKNGDINVKQRVIYLMSRILEMSLQSKYLMIVNLVVIPKRFTMFCFSVFVKEMHIMCDKILDISVKNNEPVDFHALMFKFTLDSFVQYVTNESLIFYY